MPQPAFAPDATLADALRQPVWTTRPDGSVDYANPFLRAYTGLDNDAFAAGGWALVVHPDDVPGLVGLLTASLRDGTPYAAEFRLRRADGAFRWHLASVSPVHDPDGRVVGWAGSSVDIDDRRAAEQALRASEARARDLVDHAGDVVYTLDLDGVVTDVNPAVERLLGYRPAEVIGRCIDEVIAPEQVAGTHRHLAAKLAGQPTSRYDLDVVARDGRRVTLEINSRLAVADGRPVAIHGIARDVSAQRAAAAAAREQGRQARLTAAVASAVAGDGPLAPQLQACAEAIVDLVGAAFARIWTLEPDGATLALRASAGDYTHLDGPHGRIAVGRFKIGRIAAERRPHLTNAVVGDPDVSDQAWAEREGMVAFAGYPLVAGDELRGVLGLFARRPLAPAALDLLGSVADVVAVGIDRAEVSATRDAALARERAARRDAEAAEGRYRGLFEGVADAILVVDGDGRYRDANAAAFDLLGYSRDELLSRRTGDLAVERTWAVDEFARFSAEGRWRGEMELRRKDGTTVPVEIRATVVDLPDGPVNISALRDVGERRAMEREQREFLEAVSHDLKNPMSVVQAHAGLLGRRARRGTVPEAEVLARVADSIVGATLRMETQLDEFQDALRLRSGHAVELRTEPADLVDLAGRAVADAQAATDRHRLRLETILARLPAVVDPLRVRRVVDNLLGNAVKYSPDGGAVAVTLACEDGPGGGWAVVTVRDEGVGIPAGDLPHVFDRYRRGSNVDGSVRGNGVGLSGVRQIVEQHGGTVDGVSVEGLGSAFTVRLPLGQLSAGGAGRSLAP